MTKKGRNPDRSPIRGIITSDSSSEKTTFKKYNIEMPTTNIILGINEETVRPYKEDMSNCFRLGSMSSSFIFNIKIAPTRPMVNTQNRIWMMVSKCDSNNRVMDCSQYKAKISTYTMAKHNRKMVNSE